MIRKIYIIICGLIIGGLFAPAIGQIEEEVPVKKAWELGVGGSVFQMTRFNIINAYQKEDGHYNINTQKKDVLFGGNIYVARELNSHFYLDFQGTLGYTRDKLSGGVKDDRFLAMGGVGLQWRLGEYFGSKYIDPYLRVGANYMYKNFNVVYKGDINVNNDEISWRLDNLYNKEKADKTHSFPIAAGAGVNMWLNDRVGLGIQADYLILPYKDVANSFEGTVRIMWRLGGKSKKSKPVVEYVEVEKRVEVPIEVIKEIEVIREVPSKEIFGNLFDNIHFEFDKDIITSDSEQILDQISKIMLSNTSKKYLIIGHTDARGSASYNMDLSRRRANAVVNALKERGVPTSILKARGLGKKASFVPSSETNDIRLGDRKVTVEVISNNKYWDFLAD